MEIHSALIGLVNRHDVNKGTSFLSGAAPSAHSTAGTKAIADVEKITTNPVYVVKTPFITTGELESIGAAMMGITIGEIGKEAGKLIGEYTGKGASLVGSIPGKIAQAAADKFNEPGVKLSISDVLDELMKDIEDITKEQAEKNEAECKSNKINEVKENITKGVTTAKKFVDDATEDLNKIVEYALEGSEWMAEHMTKKIENTTQNIKKTLDEQYTNIEKNVNEFCKGEGDKIGMKLVELYNNGIRKAAHKVKDLKDTTMSKTSITAISSIQKAKLNIMSMTGINLPI